MSTALTHYNGRGFWSDQTGIQLWLTALSKEIEAQEGAPEWVHVAGRFWLYEALHRFGMIVPRVDDYVKGAENAELLATIASRAVQKLEAMAAEGKPRISLETFGLSVAGWPPANAKISLEYVIVVGRTFVAMLRGEMPAEMYPAPHVTRDGLVHHEQGLSPEEIARLNDPQTQEPGPHS
jgi:hypothetical protein